MLASQKHNWEIVSINLDAQTPAFREVTVIKNATQQEAMSIFNKFVKIRRPYAVATGLLVSDVQVGDTLILRLDEKAPS